MKTIQKSILSFILCIYFLPTNAQFKQLFLFDDFTQGITLMKNGSKMANAMNYDVVNRNMVFLEGEEMFMLDNLPLIDTVYLNHRKFIPQDQRFVEVRSTENGIVYIDWYYKEINQGKQGAYGTTQGTVELVNTQAFRSGGKYEWESIEVTKTKNQNEYAFKYKEKLIRFKNKKSLLKQFKNQTAIIEDFVKQADLHWETPEDVIKIANYCMGL